MARKHVLDIGNCCADHGAIRQLLESQFAVNLRQVHSAAEALNALQESNYQLILVNRVFDQDGDDGLALIGQIKQHAAWKEIPIMLISNYTQYQQRAMELGAEPGFGKAQLADRQTTELLGRYLD